MVRSECGTSDDPQDCGKPPLPEVVAQDDAHPRPALADLGDNARHLLDRAGAGRHVRTPLAGQQQVPAAEHVERQIAVLFIVAVVEPAFLHPVQRDVGVAEIQHDLARRTPMRLEEQTRQLGQY
jgi:hypothetical protein